MHLRAPTSSPVHVAGRRVAVIGAGCSGAGSARLLTRAGAEVIVADSKSAHELQSKHIEAILETGAKLRLGITSLDMLGPVNLVVISPGVAPRAAIVEQARAAGVPVMGEIELGYRFSRAPIVAIAGTNAKGSTCSLIEKMLISAGIQGRMCGNVGNAFTNVIATEEPPEVYVLEVSSFQLETLYFPPSTSLVDVSEKGSCHTLIAENTSFQFRPSVACLLNITEDHLDRHGSWDSYVAAKARLFTNQEPDDWAIVNADDPNVMRAAQGARSRKVRFSAQGSAAEARLEGDRLVVDLGGGAQEICRTSDLVRAGVPYIQTVLASAAAALIAGARPEALVEAVRSHKLPPEVLEFVCEVGGVRFINSSKATNPAAAIADIESVNGPLLVIAGGQDRGLDFTEFAQVLRNRAKAVFLIGQSAKRIAEAAAGVQCVFSASLEEAVESAYAAAAPGDTILLAPGCASQDMFSDYKARGTVFRQIAHRICQAVHRGNY